MPRASTRVPPVRLFGWKERYLWNRWARHQMPLDGARYELSILPGSFGKAPSRAMTQIQQRRREGALGVSTIDLYDPKVNTISDVDHICKGNLTHGGSVGGLAGGQRRLRSSHSVEPRVGPTPLGAYPPHPSGLPPVPVRGVR